MHVKYNKILYYFFFYIFITANIFSKEKLKMEYYYSPKIKIFFSKNWGEMQLDKQKYLENATSLEREDKFSQRINYNIAISNKNFDENKSIIYFRKFQYLHFYIILIIFFYIRSSPSDD